MRKIERTKDQCFICGKHDLIKSKDTEECVDDAIWIALPNGKSVIVCREHTGLEELI